MGPGRRLLTRLLLAAICGACAAIAAGQSSQPATASTPGWELPAEVRAALDQTQDFAFNFDQPGFYAVLQHVKGSPRSPGFAQTPIEVNNWQDLLERPNDFRGRPITIEGIVGRGKAPYQLQRFPQLGELWQLELWREDQPVACTLILTEQAADIPVNALIQVTGYFVMIRQYYGRSKRVQQAALLVATGPTSISRSAPRFAVESTPDWPWMLGAVLLGLLITIILLRRSAGGGRRDVRALRAAHPAPLDLADDLAAWADRDQRRPNAADEDPRGTDPGEEW